MPDAMGDAMGRLPASCANFLISNRSVLVPTFNCATDARALDVLSRCFPSRRVIGIDSREMVAGLGAIHCCSQQQPRAPEARE
jgi:agmatine deiminase